MAEGKRKLLKMKSSDVRAAMSKKWAAPEYAVMWEVGQGTGAASGRYADAIIMSLWPSRGLELHGVEIKVSRSDWKREAADPTKAEAIAKYCDRWYIHTPKGLIQDLSEVPPAWGVREYDGARWFTVREAEKTEAAPMDRAFLAALLRRADGIMRAMIEDAIRSARQKEVEEYQARRDRFKEEVDRAAKRRTDELSGMAEQFSAFEAAFGEGLLSRWGDLKPLGAAARMLSDLAKNQSWTEWQTIEKRLRDAADAMASARETFAGLEVETQDLLSRKAS